MVGGTNFPPYDSKNEPWSNEQKTKATPKPSTKGKSKPEAILLERSSLATRSLEVSLDNADTVIDGLDNADTVIEGCPASRGLVFDTWDVCSPREFDFH